MRVSHGNYIFASKNGFYGLVISDDTEISIIECFEKLLIKHTIYKIASKEIHILDYPINDQISVSHDRIAAVGNKIAHYLKRGTVVLTNGIRKGTTTVVSGIQKGSNKIQSKITPNETPTKVSQTTQSNIGKAKMAGVAIAKVSGAIVTGAVAAVNALSHEISNGVSQTALGKKIVSESGPKTQAAKEIVKSAVAGVFTIYDEVVTAGLTLVKETGTQTANVAKHKYGDDVGLACQNTADIVDSVANAAVNLNRLGTKALAKRVAANTTVEMLSDETEKKQLQESRLTIDPITGLQALAVVNQIDNMGQQSNEMNRIRRQQYIGLQHNNDNDYQLIRDHNVDHANEANIIDDQNQDILEVD